MALTGRRPTPTEYEGWRAASVQAYAEDLLDAGRVGSGEAVATANQSYVDLLPQGLDTPDAVVLRLEDGGAHVGWLWVGRSAPRLRDDTAWVYDIEVDAALRGRGYGRAAMLLAEDVARSIGAEALGLNVFGGNTVARSLYVSLGYKESSVVMRKPL